MQFKFLLFAFMASSVMAAPLPAPAGMPNTPCSQGCTLLTNLALIESMASAIASVIEPVEKRDPLGGNDHSGWKRDPLGGNGHSGWKREPLGGNGHSGWKREPLGGNGHSGWKREPLGGNGHSGW